MAEENMSPEEKQHFRQARLRDLLRAQLKGGGKNPGKILAETFDGKLARETIGGNESAESDGAGMLEGAFTAAKNAAFAMSTAETEAEVKRLLRESQRELASLAAGGILDTESPALFARVSLAHRRCQEHRCVR
ncbi:hypothetical protein EON80_29665 [bacterium]|nr:MAG: hypothetical protein EON80_29665 [bacterium]